MGRTAHPGEDARTPQTPDLSTVPDPLGKGPIVTERRREYPLGTRRMSQAGYINVKTGSMKAPIWESEGRLVLERHLGRRLRDDEEVRHKRDVPIWDNRLEGLELWRRGRPVRFRGAGKPRTPWKRLYGEAIAMLAELDERGIFDSLDADQRADVQRVLDARP